MVKILIIICFTFYSYLITSFFVPFSNNELSSFIEENKHLIPLAHSNHAYFVDNDNLEIGRCNPIMRTITIDINYWKKSTYKEKILLLAHEYYHCNCLKSHNDSIDNTVGCYNSYMSSYSQSKWCVDLKFEKYLKQIKQGCDYDY